MELDQAALTAAHVAVEDELIWMRDAGMSMPFHANGFVVRNYDGTESCIMRLGTRDGLRIGIKAYLMAQAAAGRISLHDVDL